MSGLVGELRRAATADTAEQCVELRAGPVRLETDKAVPIGLIVNELVTNALKYAYPAGAPGVVRVILEQDDAGTITLIVEDDGVGMTEPIPAKGGGLGTVIVRSMAETLRATVTLDRSHKGTRTIVRLTPSS